jgi:hypothetical protein
MLVSTPRAKGKLQKIAVRLLMIAIGRITSYIYTR